MGLIWFVPSVQDYPKHADYHRQPHLLVLSWIQKYQQTSQTQSSETFNTLEIPQTRVDKPRTMVRIAQQLAVRRIQSANVSLLLNKTEMLPSDYLLIPG